MLILSTVLHLQLCEGIEGAASEPYIVHAEDARAFEIAREKSAGDGVGVGADEDVDEAAGVAELDALICGKLAVELFGEMRVVVAALHEIENHPEIYGEFGVRVCRQTLYSYVEKRIFARLTNKDLPFKGSRQKKKTKHIRRMKSAAKGDSIEKRPEEVNTRQEPGHWEMDLVVSCRGGHKCLMALTERVTRQEIMRLIPDKSAASVVRAMNTLERKYGKMFPEVFKTITVDNGSEFSAFSQVENWGCAVYFAHPYTSWERPQNERHNGLFRAFVPKGVSIEAFSAEYILAAADELNGRPRKKLGYRTPEELFDEFLDSVYAAEGCGSIAQDGSQRLPS